MARPRCDPFDAAAILTAIGKGETTPFRAYQDYAAMAARPYARSTFEIYLRGHERLGPLRVSRTAVCDDGLSLAARQRAPQARRSTLEAWSPALPEPRPAVPPAPHAIEAAADAESDAFWSTRRAVKPRVVTAEADNASLIVKGGSLFVRDGDRCLRYDAGARMPAAIVMAGWGGFVSVEALRFCASHRIAIVVLDWMRDLLTVMPGAPRAAAALLRAQALADPAWIASRVVKAKIENTVRVGALASDEAARFIDAARRATTVQKAMIVEAQAARVSWGTLAPKLQWRAGSPRVSPAWKEPMLARQRADLGVKRYATHPVNAMLNAAFSVTAGRLVSALQAAGAHPAVGFLHADKPGRWSLAWDAIEPLRPSIEASLFAFIRRHQFSGGDFIRVQDARGSIRLGSNLLRVVVAECAPSHALLSDAQKLRRLAGRAAFDRLDAFGDHQILQPHERANGRILAPEIGLYRFAQFMADANLAPTAIERFHERANHPAVKAGVLLQKGLDPEIC
jgi:CRISP-associated protein Cas1